MTQDDILRACQHTDRQTSEVKMTADEVIQVCTECWNASVAARRAARKVQLSDHWAKYRTEQAIAMREAGAEIGQRVSYFCRSMLGFGGYSVLGTIVANRNRIAVVKLDHVQDGKTQTEWNKGWKPCKQA
jgi:hypothetical protein